MSLTTYRLRYAACDVLDSFIPARHGGAHPTLSGTWPVDVKPEVENLKISYSESGMRHRQSPQDMLMKMKTTTGKGKEAHPQRKCLP